MLQVPSVSLLHGKRIVAQPPQDLVLMLIPNRGSLVLEVEVCDFSELPAGGIQGL